MLVPKITVTLPGQPIQTGLTAAQARQLVEQENQRIREGPGIDKDNMVASTGGFLYTPNSQTVSPSYFKRNSQPVPFPQTWYIFQTFLFSHVLFYLK